MLSQSSRRLPKNGRSECCGLLDSIRNSDLSELGVGNASTLSLGSLNVPSSVILDEPQLASGPPPMVDLAPTANLSE